MRFKPWLVVVAVSIGLVAILGFIKFTQIKAAIAFGESFPEPSETVAFQTVEFSAWRPEISVVGEVRASRELLLRSEAEGIIAKIGFEAGSRVNAGDVLLQLNISEEQARLKALDPQIELAELDVKRLSGLVNRQAVSQQEADQVEARLAIVKGEAALVRELIIDKTVTAPFDGYTGLHDFEVGEYLPVNTVITNLVGGLDTLWVDFSLPQQYASLDTGTTVFLQLAEEEAGRLPATVSALEPSISSASRTLRARAVFNNKDRTLKPGAIVKVLTPVEESREVIRVPNTAVRLDAFGSYVFTLGKDDSNQWRAKRQPVQVITTQSYDSIIAGGLQPGEVVATTGSFKLREGLLVYQAQDQSSGVDENVQNSLQLESDSGE